VPAYYAIVLNSLIVLFMACIFIESQSAKYLCITAVVYLYGMWHVYVDIRVGVRPSPATGIPFELLPRPAVAPANPQRSNSRLAGVHSPGV